MVLHRSRRGVRGLLIMLLLPLMVACPKPNPPAPVLTGPDPAAYDALVADKHRIEQAVREQERMLREYEARIHRLQLQLLESDARHQAQQAQLSLQQSMLDEAVIEVVRTKAKLRSIESRAEAASSMAEAEIALKGLAERIATNDGGPPEDYLKAEALLRMSTNEFKKENYGGALYLAGQAQNQIRSMESNLSHQVGYSLAPGEVLFAQPLPLKVLKRSNLRQTPSLKAKIKGTLNKGAMIVGYSYKAEWIRVHTEDGGQGWIFQTLVGGR